MSVLARFTPGGDEDAMCGSDGGGTATSRVRVTARPPCVKCHPPAPVPLACARVRAEFLCRSCILAATQGRVKRALCSTALTAQAVLLAYSGGASSRVALDAAAQVMHCGRKRRWWADGAVVHVDAAPLWGLMRGGSGDDESVADAPGGAEALRAVLTATLRAGLHTYVVPLEAACAAALVIVPVAAPDVEPDALATGGAGGSAGCADAGPYAVFSHARVAPLVDAALARVAAARALPALRTARAALLESFQAGALRRAGDAPAGGALRPPPPLLDLRQGRLEALTEALLADAARALAFPRLVTAATVDRLAHAVFVATCGGAGRAVPALVAAVDDSCARAAAKGLLPPPRVALEPVESGGGSCSDAGGAAASDPLLRGLQPLARLAPNWYPALLQQLPDALAAGASSGGVAGGAGAIGSAGSASGAPGAGGAPSNDAPGGVTIVRCASEVERREAALVRHLRALDASPASAATFLTFAAASGAPSVTGRSLDVLTGLQASFPATVHNVVRTAAKVNVKE